MSHRIILVHRNNTKLALVCKLQFIGQQTHAMSNWDPVYKILMTSTPQTQLISHMINVVSRSKAFKHMQRAEIKAKAVVEVYITASVTLKCRLKDAMLQMAISSLKMRQNHFWPGLCCRPHWGAYYASPDPLVFWRGRYPSPFSTRQHIQHVGLIFCPLHCIFRNSTTD